MTKIEKELVRHLRVAFLGADRWIVEQTQLAYISRHAWLHAWALETLLEDTTQ